MKWLLIILNVATATSNGHITTAQATVAGPFDSREECEHVLGAAFPEGQPDQSFNCAQTDRDFMAAPGSKSAH